MRKGGDSDIERKREREKHTHTHTHTYGDLHFTPVEELPLHPLPPSRVLFFFVSRNTFSR